MKGNPSLIGHGIAITFFVVILMTSVFATQIQVAHTSGKSPYRSGYDHGCDDADISDSDDRYINQPEKGPSFHTNEFMRGYNDGYNACQNENESNNANLPLCDGSYQDCVTDDGYVCQAGSTDEECELNGYYCVEDIGCGNFVHGICEDCKIDDEDGGKGLKVIVHFDHDDRVCVVEYGNLCSIPNGGKSGKAGETVTFTFEPGEIEVGENKYSIVLNRGMIVRMK